MATEADSQLTPIIDWIQTHDAHAAHHVALLREADRALTDAASLAKPDRTALADRLERWRYQWLNERVGRLTDEDRSLIDSLDLAANRIAGRSERSPRAPRIAIESEANERLCSMVWPAWPGPDAGQIRPREPDQTATDFHLDTAKKWLDPNVPLDALAHRAAQLTAARYGAGEDAASLIVGRRMLLYAPIYLSSFCINECTYCGFRFDQSIERKHLSTDEAMAEALILRRRGFRHLLLVAGEFPRLARTEYFTQIIERLCESGLCPAVEIAPQSTSSYAAMVEAGLRGVTLYQETYQEDLYRQYHPGGTKASFDWRLEGPDRAVEAGVERLGLGVLLGLADPREDILAMMRHAAYLRERFPDLRLAFSLPRIHEAPASFKTPYSIDDDSFVRFYCALRLTFPAANLVLSTRESPALRARLADICITQLSAGSCTAPGGYGQEPTDGQFPVNDQRGVQEVTDWLETKGFKPVWDFDALEGSA